MHAAINLGCFDESVGLLIFHAALQLNAIIAQMAELFIPQGTSLLTRLTHLRGSGALVVAVVLGVALALVVVAVVGDALVVRVIAGADKTVAVPGQYARVAQVTAFPADRALMARYQVLRS